VTLNAAAHSAPARLSADPALVAALAIAFIAADTLAGAWFFQLVLDIRPCPLCLEQRYAYYLALPLALLVAFAAARGAPKSLLLAGFAVLLLAALANAWLGGYHAGVESFPSTDVGEGNIQTYLELVARNVRVKHIDVIDHDPLKDPYGGMVVACGKTMPALPRQ